ncbi:CHAT domain-containing protein [Mycena capillaripes]|nr:CHAT domain-containing protein [Mycena capillaripes]
MHQRILLLSTTNADRGMFLNLLGDICLEQWEGFSNIDTLNEAVCAYEDAVRDNPADTEFQQDLGDALLELVQWQNDVTDITKYVSVMEKLVRDTPDGDPARPGLLNNLGNSLVTRFEHLGDLTDLNKSVLFREDALRLIPDSDFNKPAYLNNLGISLFRRFGHLGDLADLNKSVLLKEQAIHLTPEGHPDKPSRLSNLGSSLLTRFENLGNLADLDKSVLLKEEAVCLTPEGHPDKPLWLSNLGNSLFRRFQHLGNLADLKKSVLLQEEAVHLTPEGHPDKPLWLNNLGNSLIAHFQRFGDLEDLNKSVLVREDAVCLTPDGHVDKPAWLSNLGNSLFRRFQHLGDLADLNKSVLMKEEAVRMTPEGHPDKPSSLNNLAISLSHRFEYLGDLAELNRSVLLEEEAVHLTPESHPAKPSWLNNLGNSLFRRFEHLGNLDDLNKSVLLQEEAVRLSPEGHPDKPSLLNNLGTSLLTRSGCLGNLADLNRSVLLIEEAVCLTPEGHPDKPLRLNNLGNSLHSRFQHLGNLADLNKSVLLKEDAVYLTPEGHPDKPLWLNNLGNAFHARFKQLGAHADLEKAICHYSTAARARTGPAHLRFQAATSWAHSSPPSSLDAYHIALDLIPEIAWLGLSICDRHNRLSKAGQVVRDAAATAIASGDSQKAVEWLEQGRSVIWGQLLDLRTPVDALRQKHFELANRLVFLSAQLEGSGIRASDSDRIESSTQQSLQSVAENAHQSAYEREELLKQIRALPGFSRFLLPKTFSELSQAAQQGPVTILNVSKKQCDALVLRPGCKNEVLHIPLPNFKAEDAGNQAKALGEIVGRSERLFMRQEDHLKPEDLLKHNLAELWFGIVKPVLDGLGITTPTKSNMQRVWWCPTGPLSFLPIHAAGLYGLQDASGSKLSDFVISSYAPSLTALIEGFRLPSKSPKAPQLLAVAQASASGQVHIPGTLEEISHIQRLATGRLPVLRLDKNMATVESVKQGMIDSRWAHFACHGVQNVTTPTESALLLAGSSRLTLSNIIQLALPHADLAFLSACQTATGDKSLEEESVHLAAGMLLAGYRGVIATMWTIMDKDAPQVASDVYEHLFTTSPPDPTRAAGALHLAVQKLREKSSKKTPFFHWVPFIHIGV